MQICRQTDRQIEVGSKARQAAAEVRPRTRFSVASNRSTLKASGEVALLGSSVYPAAYVHDACFPAP